MKTRLKTSESHVKRLFSWLQELHQPRQSGWPRCGHGLLHRDAPRDHQLQARDACCPLVFSRYASFSQAQRIRNVTKTSKSLKNIIENLAKTTENLAKTHFPPPLFTSKPSYFSSWPPRAMSALHFLCTTFRRSQPDFLHELLLSLPSLAAAGRESSAALKAGIQHFHQARRGGRCLGGSQRSMNMEEYGL